MRKRKKGRKFGRRRGVRRAFLRSLVAALILHGRITTTRERAKELQPLAERAITLGKKNTLAARRELRKKLPSRAVRTIMTDLSPRFAARRGGYTRIRKLSTPRRDAAERVIIELVE